MLRRALAGKGAGRLVEEVLAVARASGHQTEKVYLSDYALTSIDAVYGYPTKHRQRLTKALVTLSQQQCEAIAGVLGIGWAAQITDSGGGSRMLDRDTIQRIAEQQYDAEYDAVVFSDSFRLPIVNRGHLTKDEFITIVKWKAARVAGQARRNSKIDVEEATRDAFAAQDACTAAWRMDSLRGVDVRMASAILTVFDPCRYTVMDQRAWASLKRLGLARLGLGDWMSLDSERTYRAYVDACTTIARKNQVDLRTLDRCLWALNGKLPAQL